MTGRFSTGEDLVTAGWGSKVAKAGRGDIGFVCSLMVGEAEVGEEGVGEWGQSLKEKGITSRDVFETSVVGENKDNLAKCVVGEETDVGDGEAGAFFVFLDLRRGGTGGGGMMAESGTQ